MSSPTDAASAPDGAVVMTYREAIRTALDDAMAADDTVLLLGEDIAKAGGPFKTTVGLYEEYGADRVFDTPIAENGFCGIALGMALSAQTSSTGESWFMQFYGLQVAVAGSPQGAYGLLRAAIAHNNPVVVFDHKAMHLRKGPVVRGDDRLAEIGRAVTVRPGADVTVVASLLMVHRSLEAAGVLAAEGIDVEVIDISWLRPLDVETVAASVARTGRLVIAEEQYHDGGWGSAVISRLATAGAPMAVPPVAVSMPEILISHSSPLEDAMIPSTERIAEAVRSVCR